MGTYSNLRPSAYRVNNGAWTTIKPSVIEVDEGNQLAILEVAFVLPASRLISGVSCSFDAYTSAYSEELTSYLVINNASISQEQYGISYQVYTYTGSFNASLSESDRFIIYFDSRSAWYIDNISVDVDYEDPPSVSIVSPNDTSFDVGSSFTYSWTVSNGTQTSAVIQESSDGSNWTDKYTISGSTTYRNTSASQVGVHYWRVVVTTSWYGLTVTVTSNTGIYSVTEPYVPPEPPAPDNPPVMGNVTATPVHTGTVPATFSAVYIAGISRCRVEAVVQAGTNQIREVYFNCSGYSGNVNMQYDSSLGKYVGTTPYALSASTSVTVTAVDTKSYYTTSSPVSVTVQPYADPTITLTTLYRCDSSGAETNSGQYYKIQVTASCSSVSNLNRITSIAASVEDGILHDNLNSGQTYIFGPELLNEDLVYVIQISVTDLVGHENTVERSLSGRMRDVVFRRDIQHETAHIGVGMSPAGNARATIQLPPNGTIIIGGQDLISWLQETLGESFPGWNQ